MSSGRSSKRFAEILKEDYLPAVKSMLRDHEEWCAANPEAAAFLAALPNGGWRKDPSETKAGKP